ncbi:MFS transporter [Aquisalinus flavus]|uniref:MFS transporter n=1 Tax=Aquisalinus flavus TaxID=1526572 RepID=A0A8J2V1U6_9PROT|nr:MFS transporter [Aquisalinus flavus]MBD0426737.1 MFS transporter [Aquisalinus flavus]UNE46598.1 MFS transporter [Aquisalinus flavus]GGC95572.1 MFS transporter [Aquisalinus flavus]
MPDSSAQPQADEPRSQQFIAFRYPAFVLYWAARFLASFAVQVLSVSVAWQVYDLTRNPADLGMIGLVQFLPLLLLVFVTGTVADTVGRRKVMGAAIALELICAGAILYFSVSGLSGPVPIFIALTGIGIARAFFGPAAQSLVVNLVPKSVFPNAVAWNSSSWQIASIGGPVGGGLLYGIGAPVAYGVSVAMLAIALILVLIIPRPPVRSGEGRKVTISSLFDGLRFIRKEKVVLGAITLDLFAVLLGGAVALLPVYARDILHMGPWGLGLLRAAPGIGAVIVAAFLAAKPVRDHAGKWLLVYVALFGVFTVVFGLSTITWLSIVALALIGGADMVSVYIRETLLQLWTPDEVRGRVNAVNMVFLGASNELGEFRAGFMAAWIGAVPAVIFGGVGAVAVAGIAWVVFPELRDAKSLVKTE